jgi:hypothetical protein
VLCAGLLQEPGRRPPPRLAGSGRWRSPRAPGRFHHPVDGEAFAGAERPADGPGLASSFVSERRSGPPPRARSDDLERCVVPSTALPYGEPTLVIARSSAAVLAAWSRVGIEEPAVPCTPTLGRGYARELQEFNANG